MTTVPPEAAAQPLNPPATHAPPRNFTYWLSTTNHKDIGILYLGLGALFFLIGGVEALVMRLQLAVPGNTLLRGETYNEFFTLHGTTMIFLAVMPMLLGFSNYLVPLQIGAKDMAFPRLNAFGFWLSALGGLTLYLSLLEGPPSMGWFAYAPLNERPFSMSLGTDFWAAALLLTGTGTTLTAINIIVTASRYRAVGMGLWKMPLFSWMAYVNSFIIVFAFPALNAALIMLEVDRVLSGHFFSHGGSPVLWQHYFWLFGHPEVYIMILPAWGIISEVIPVFSRKPIFGYEFVAGSTLAIAVLSFAVYAHHMFAVGFARPVNLAFAASTMLIAVPTGIKVTNWVATLWKGSIRFTVPMLYALAFILQFTFGGITGVSFAVLPIDWQVTDTYYVVAHLHYVLMGGTLFALLSGLHFYYPKMTGRMLSDALGKLAFWMIVLGFNGVFLVQHVLGLMGMPRRVYTYPDLPGWGALNMISTVGAFVLGLGLLLTLINLVVSRRLGRVAGDNPWQAWTLEWLTSSPPPKSNFSRLPPVHSSRPLWDLQHPHDPDHKRPRRHDKGGHIREEEKEHHQ
ncbi:cytochrome c oxidase subunit I [Deinococcus irradiatisoli]|uniref:Cytochrome c oxidase subunit 1 n=1 Tax=Deinococcus irradiatisoli TaxID=2202254 RepID=A0A2Z3JGZ6_9DEIO|nr:cytochrome c oxidase subunit I [Deinococcus irradiatisoli]AWN22771.1 cytochrome c oxidase subunit I [Deinococcus irradiatisoli]